MKNSVFFVMMAHGVVASSVAASLEPLVNSEETMIAISQEQSASNNDTQLAPEAFVSSQSGMAVAFVPTPEEWTNKLDREFRALALKEATGEISRTDMERLEWLSKWRESLVCPRVPDEILLQLRRDRVAEGLAAALKKYVEFQEGAHHSRRATR